MRRATSVRYLRVVEFRVFVCVDIPERVHSLHQLIQRQMNDVRSLFYAHQTHAVVIDCLLL